MRLKGMDDVSGGPPRRRQFPRQPTPVRIELVTAYAGVLRDLRNRATPKGSRSRATMLARLRTGSPTMRGLATGTREVGAPIPSSEVGKQPSLG